MEQPFRDDLRYWVNTDPRVADRLLRIVEECLRSPFEGIGKPEPLRGLSNTWSRRLTDEHRLVYRVTDESIDFLQARYHYSLK
jgi:toxin YoeB